MGGQRKTSIPSKSKHFIFTFHETNNNKLESIIEFNISIYDNMIGYL